MLARRVLPLFLSLGVVACAAKHPPFAGSTIGVDATDAGPDASLLKIGPPPPPAADAAGYCGNLVIPVAVDRPNLYFVLDRSGSMSDPITQTDGGGVPSGPSPRPLKKFEAARIAIVDLLKTIGHRVSYGVTVFPGSGDTTGCGPGTEIWKTQPGDPVSYALAGTIGPVLNGLATTLTLLSPGGRTPTAATLAVLGSTLPALPGKTYAFLLTDGAPNCGDSPCNSSTCTINIEQLCTVPAGVNCCDPALGVGDYGLCLDADPTVAAVAALAASGIQTFIIGLPGTTAYTDLLDRLAVAGGTARPGEPQYYPTASSDELATTLQQVGLSVAISCVIPLTEQPPDRSLVNVYFDKTVVPTDPQNGWIWTADGSVEIMGDSCKLLKGGDVFQLQVVAGCPTVTR